MELKDIYLLLADTVLVIHFSFVIFVVIGLVLILIGRLFNWRWIYNRTFRYFHIATITIVVLQAWMGQLCPLTILENYLRINAGQTTYSTTFIQHWLHKVLYYDAAPWVFSVMYTTFGMLILITWLADRERISQYQHRHMEE